MKKRKVGLMGRRAVYGYLFILPFIIGFIFFMVKPLVQSLIMSLSEVTISTQGFSMVTITLQTIRRLFW